MQDKSMILILSLGIFAVVLILVLIGLPFILTHNSVTGAVVLDNKEKEIIKEAASEPVNEALVIETNEPSSEQEDTQEQVIVPDSETVSPRRSSHRRSSGDSSGSSGSSGGSSDGGDSGGSGGVVVVGQALMYVDPSAVNVNANQEFNVSVKINTEWEVYGVELDLYFNPAVLEVLRINEGDFLKQDGTSTFKFNDIDNEGGSIGFADTRLSVTNGISGQGGVLADVTFRAKSTGTSSLELDFVKVVNPNIEKINTTTSNGNVAVS